jgi:hypothetical protein
VHSDAIPRLTHREHGRTIVHHQYRRGLGNCSDTQSSQVKCAFWQCEQALLAFFFFGPSLDLFVEGSGPSAALRLPVAFLPSRPRMDSDIAGCSITWRIRGGLFRYMCLRQNAVVSYTKQTLVYRGVIRKAEGCEGVF